MSYHVEKFTAYRVVETKSNIPVAICILEREAEYIKECMEEIEKEKPKVDYPIL